jgi:hypothetical protein
MSDRGVEPGGLVGGWDDETRQFTVVGWDAGPAGLAWLELGDGVSLDMDFGSPGLLSGLRVDGPLSGNRRPLPEQAQATLSALFGWDVVDALRERASSGGPVGLGPLSSPGYARRGGPGELAALGRLAVLRAIAAEPVRSGLSVLVASIEGAALAVTAADRLGLPVLRALARADAEEAAELVPDLGAELIESALDLDPPSRPAIWADRFDLQGRRRARPGGPPSLALAAAARRAAGLLTPALAGRLTDLAADLERAAGEGDDADDADAAAGGGPSAAGPPREWAVATPAAMAPSPAPMVAARMRASKAGGGLEVADADVAEPVVEQDVGHGLRAVITGPTELEIRGAGPGPPGRWVRAVRADGVLLALGPVGDDGTGRVLLPPGLGLAEVRFDVTAEPSTPQPSPAVISVRDAVAAGRAACRAERDGDRAAEVWADCARQWDGLQEPRRAALANAFARGEDPTVGQGTGRRRGVRQPEASFLLDRFT